MENHPIHQAALVLGRMLGVTGVVAKHLTNGGMALKATLTPPSLIFDKSASLTMVCQTSALSKDGTYSTSLFIDGHWSPKVGPVLHDLFRASASAKDVSLAARLRDLVLAATSFVTALCMAEMKEAYETSILAHVPEERQTFFRHYFAFLHDRLHLKDTSEENMLWKQAVEMMWLTEVEPIDKALDELELRDTPDDDLLKKEGSLQTIRSTLVRLLEDLEGSATPLLYLAHLSSLSRDEYPLTFGIVGEFFATFWRLVQETYPSMYSAFLWGVDQEEDDV